MFATTPHIGRQARRIALVLGLSVLALPPALAGDAVKTLPAATDAYNRLVFPEPYAQVVIPPDAPLADDPIPLSGHRGLLLRPREGASGAIPVFVQLRSGASFTVRLKPEDGAEPAVFRYRDAPDMAAKPQQERRPADRWIAETVLAALDGERPEGFEASEPPRPARLVLDEADGESVRLTPETAWRGSRHRLRVYRLQADRMVNVEPRDFYRQGVVAVTVEGDVVGPHHRPRLIILEVDDDR